MPISSAVLCASRPGWLGRPPLLNTIPGVGRRIAECLIAEIGVDMSRFQTSARLSLWAAMCPGNNESGGSRRSGKTRRGLKWFAANLAETAEAADHSKDTYLGGQFQRLRGEGQAKARKAVKHSMLVTAFHVLDQRVLYVDLRCGLVLKTSARCARPTPRAPDRSPRISRHDRTRLSRVS
jgi:transposase